MAGYAKLSFEQLLDWLEGRLAATAAHQVASQIAQADATTQAQVRWLAAFLKLSKEVVLAAPPPTVRATLRQHFADFARSRQPPTLIQRLVAVLTFDSGQAPVLAGLRAGASEPIRQYIFVTELADVTLNIQPRTHDERLDLIGQILLNDELVISEAFTVQLVHQAREVAITLADEVGEFWFEALAPGDYALMLSTARVEIELPPFALLRD